MRKYDTREHKAAVAHYRELVDAGDGWCAEPICLMDTRYIPPGSKIHACHDPTGTYYIGPGHPRCNTSEGARRGHAMRKQPRRRWAI